LDSLYAFTIVGYGCKVMVFTYSDIERQIAQGKAFANGR